MSSVANDGNFVRDATHDPAVLGIKNLVAIDYVDVFTDAPPFIGIEVRCNQKQYI